MLSPVDHANDRLVAIFGHELRSHLAPIKNAAELLQRSTIDPATTLRIAGIIERQVDGMTRLVDELLGYTQTKAFALLLRRADTAVQEIIERSIEMIEPLMRARRHVLSVRMPTEPIAIEGDTVWLTQAVQNVIGNAVKYTDPGGQIDIVVDHDDVNVEIRVRDTGIGLAPADLETVFLLFTQATQLPTRPSAGGLGVGLHLAKVVVDAHGGSIRATSDGLGRGSTFVLRLPCRRSSSRTNRALDSAALTSGEHP